MSNGIVTGSPALAIRARLAAYLALTKPELTLLSVASAVASAYLALPAHGTYHLLLNVFLGTLLLGASAGTLNQYLERHIDAMMKRTARRPLPAGTLRPREALVFGALLGSSGFLYLWGSTGINTALLAALTFTLYLGVYTPLKKHTPFATVVGAVAGALPPLIGWTAVRDGITMEGWSLFFILFFWQMPHFLSLSWLYRKDYECAGFAMLSVIDSRGSILSRQMIMYGLALLAAALMPTLTGITGLAYFTCSLVLSFGFLATMAVFTRTMHTARARLVFIASLLYLPALFAAMMMDHIR